MKPHFQQFTLVLLALFTLGLNRVVIFSMPLDSTSTIDLTNGLVAYYPFNGNANDESGNGHQGTTNGGTLTQNRFGTPNGAYDFTGENNTLSFSGFQLKDPVMTLCSWIRISDENTDTVFLSKSSLFRIMLRIVNLRYQVELSIGGKQVILRDENGAFEIDPQNPRFDFLMLSYDGTQIKFRINDQDIAYKNIDGTILKLLFPLTMNNDIIYSFHGLLDEIRIYNRLLSDTERHYLMTDTYKTTPAVTTDSVTYIGKNMATIHGTVRFEEGKDLYKFGICWGTSPNPDTANLQLLNYLILNDTVTQITLTGLLPNTTYYVRMIAMKESGISYYNELNFTTLPDIIYGSVTDVEGNVYKTVQIGNQTWMAKNLKTTKYKDGTPIPLVTDNELWGSLVSPAYCWFNNDTSFKDIYGALYNGFAVSTGNLCPTGWHVPINTEWTSIFDYLGCLNECGGMLKETGTTHWIGPNSDATNESGFTALPGSYRTVNGFDTRFGQNALWWTSTEDIQTAWCYYADGGGFHITNETKKLGCSVRCLMDEKDSTSQIDLQRGLVAYYPFNGNANDESGYGHNGTVNGATLTNDRFGHMANAYYFNGQGNYISVDNFDIPHSSMTIACWVKPSSSQEIHNYISKHGGYGNVEILIRSHNEKYRAEWTINDNYFVLSDDSLYFPINLDNPRYDLLVLEYDGSQARFYVNSVLIASKYITGLIAYNKYPMVFGRYAINDPQNADYLKGVLDDVRIYNRSLNDVEIKSLYSEGNFPQPLPSIITLKPSNINQYSANIGTKVVSYDTKSLKMRGICWSTSPNPDTTDNKSMYGSEIGLIISNLTGLDQNTTYYVRAYAINETGLHYGNEIAFQTLSNGTVNLGNGLMAYYPFNGNTNDESGRGHHGIVHGASLINDRFNNLNCAYNFNGIDNYIEVPNSPDINFGRTTNFSINIWFKILNDQSIYYGLLNKGNINSAYYELDMTLGQYPTVRFNFGERNGVASLYTYDNLSLNDNSWHMATAEAIRDKNSLLLYQDGVLIGEMTLESISDFVMSSDASLKIGVDRNFSSNFVGNIDDVRIYNRALNFSEIQSLYNESTGSITIPDLSISNNTSFEIPVKTKDLATDESIISYQFDFDYDAQKIQYENYITDGTLSSEGNILVSPLENKLAVAWTGQATLVNSSALLKFKFRALESGTVAPVISNCLINADTIRNIENGIITIEGLPTGNSVSSVKSIEMYPNPANTMLYFRNLTGKTSISIYDMQGRKVLTGIITDNQVDIGNLDHGLYTVRIEDGKNIKIEKLVKQ